MVRAVLFSEMIPENDWEQKFNNWYDMEHIPIRMDAPGFIYARRYREIESMKYLAVYEMEDKTAMSTPEYKKIKEQPSDLTKWMLDHVSGFTRYTGEMISEQINPQIMGDPYDAPILYPVMFEVPSDREEEFNSWYVEDHVPTLLKNINWLACRRFKIFSGDPEKWTHLALHYLTDASVLECEERKEARQSPWRDRLAKEEWFKGKYMLFQLLKKLQAHTK